MRRQREDDAVHEQLREITAAQQEKAAVDLQLQGVPAIKPSVGTPD